MPVAHVGDGRSRALLTPDEPSTIATTGISVLLRIELVTPTSPARAAGVAVAVAVAVEVAVGR
jgi:hypothetical protein